MKALIDQKVYVESQPFLTYETRLEALKQLKQSIIKHEQAILDALYQDLHKSPFEAYTTEIGYVLKNIGFAMKHLKSWMEVKKVPTAFFNVGATSYISKIPYGQVLLIGPYNYPFQLVIEPLIGAISAGNVVTIKPSELTPHTEAVLKRVIEDAFEKEYVQVITGGIEVTQELLQHKFDYIFFTGSTRVGKIVYQEAAKHLTPVTLELGGKSPVLIDRSANLEIAAKRVVYGKVLNAGQTCIAPDYILIDETVKEDFIKHLKETIQSFTSKPEDSAKIVSDRHIKRLELLIKQDKVVIEGSFEAGKVKPFVLDKITLEDSVMKEEIFGPVLPILTYKTLDEAITIIKTYDKPLALYIFSENKKNIQYIHDRISFGGGAVNDTILHITNPMLPFGGVGASGIGRYTGAYSFETFSHARGIMKSSSKIDLGFAYPPYNDKQLKLIKKILK